MSRLRKLINTLIGLVILLAVWQGIVLTGKYDTSLLPPPQKVLHGMGELIENGTLFTHITVSLYRFFAGYLSAVAAGIVLGLIFGWFNKLWGIFDPIVQVLRPISPIAWFPFIVLWFGIGDTPAIVIIFIAAFFPVLLSTVSAVSKVDQTYLKVAKNFGIKQPHILTKIIFPAAFPYIATGLHLALGTAWVFLVAGEMVGAQSGLGYLIIDARNNIRPDLVLAGIIFIGISGLILDRLIRLLENWVGKNWGIVPNERGI
ncbi:MAG: NitT/TauT family transport system permease protein [Epulopiscium sp.]|uniref:ABC transporter permease subunit n=1 Tax=Defluviitalea raffinosedens TaxID=1450156 RepID=A0A7C8LJE4_9FIRM|nr:ABC transporter permease [Defluviitalea raffinosedens]KAE9629452.1 ABC transporter permease subunit [Defluviitalea raffinosedens]MBM7686712.1 NitT/TauT family transport system permease protein [Defluviitalea raffinosedens]MDK2787585.1 NitT/TauT family transport system permease protein [Candidatus Epulonipiscium sp.]